MPAARDEWAFRACPTDELAGHNVALSGHGSPPFRIPSPTLLSRSATTQNDAIFTCSDVATHQRLTRHFARCDSRSCSAVMWRNESRLGHAAAGARSKAIGLFVPLG